ncbi:MAG: hypothetical protein EOO12_00105 [Chitinophagaceae bacterium]|nr:MAG: hypothetical protein EOO12_00105 [Chitinophagaceae bacterium]
MSVEGKLTAAAADVLAERARQVEVEGWSPVHDDTHTNGELARAAAAYAIHWTMNGMRTTFGDTIWPMSWGFEWFKPGALKTGEVQIARRRNLVKAGALILAEIERLDRAALAPTEKSP